MSHITQRQVANTRNSGTFIFFFLSSFSTYSPSSAVSEKEKERKGPSPNSLETVKGVQFCLLVLADVHTVRNSHMEKSQKIKDLRNAGRRNLFTVY